METKFVIITEEFKKLLHDFLVSKPMLEVEHLVAGLRNCPPVNLAPLPAPQAPQLLAPVPDPTPTPTPS